MSGSLVAFACGVILLYTFPVVPPLKWLIVALLSVLYGTLALPSRRISTLALGLAFLLAGLAWSSWHASERLQRALPVELEGKVVEVSGYLCEIPTEGSFNSLRFSFCVTRWRLPEGYKGADTLFPDKVRLAWYGREGQSLPGHRLRLKVALKQPHGAINPAGFRYETWLYRKGFRATGTIREVESDVSVPCNLHCDYMAWRQQLADSVGATLGEARHYPLVASLLIGFRGEMTPDHWEVLKATGTIHLVAISGLHLGLIALGAGFLVRRLLLWLPRSLLGPRHGRYLVYVTVALVSMTYSLAAGFTVPTRRALIMVLVAGWIVIHGRQVSPWQGLVLALFLVLLADPFSPLDQGFWLSFGAVTVLVLVFSRRLSSPSWIGALTLAQVAVFAGLWPVLAILGQGQPVSGLLANVFAIPWVSIVVMPVLMVGAALLWLLPQSHMWVAECFDLVLGGLWNVLVWLSSLDLPSGNPGVAASLGFAVLAILSLVVPSLRIRALVAIVMVPWLLMSLLVERDENSWVEVPEVWVWDVGQGLSLLVRHQDQVLLYDTGPSIPGVFSAVESVLLPNLATLGVGAINTLVISHGDSDHAGGLPLLFATLPVAEFISGEPQRVAARSGASVPTPEPCRPGLVRHIGELTLSFWRHPRVADENSNDASCVVIVTSPDGAVQIVLPGDISKNVESRMRDQPLFSEWAHEEAFRVVLAPHHGSKTSSSRSWVQWLDPEVVIYSAGYRHRFGHPHPTVVDRYRIAGGQQLNTAYSGAIRLVMGKNDIVIEEQRRSTPFWIRRPVKDWWAL
ncbi:MAG: DNA internalization-related competence protein ComEC/Rec2 [Marinobacter sp.]